MEERLLFDRIDLQRGRVSAWHAQHPVFVVADFADAFQSVEDLAPMAAGVAAHGIVLEFFVQLGRSLSRPPSQDLTERCLSFRSYGHGEENAGNQARIADTRAKITRARFAMLSRSGSYVEFTRFVLMTESPASPARRI